MVSAIGAGRALEITHDLLPLLLSAGRPLSRGWVGPIGRCQMATSQNWSNLRPASGRMPTRLKPIRSINRSDGSLGSVIRANARWTRSCSSASSSAPTSARPSPRPVSPSRQ